MITFEGSALFRENEWRTIDPSPTDVIKASSRVLVIQGIALVQ